MKTLLTMTCLAVLMVGSVSNAQTATAPAGDGTWENPYQIATLENLYWLTQNSSAWSSHFVQTSNINAAASSSWGSGFSPIGSWSVLFTGNYNGQGFIVDSIFIDRGWSSDPQGMFGATSGFSSISNVGVTNVNIVCGAVGGVLVGYATATNINNCYTTGSITGTVNRIGGIVGQASYSFGMAYSYSTCTVKSADEAGGLVGYLQEGGIYSCYSRGNVIRDLSASGTYFGGVVGRVASSSITSSFFTGSVAYLGSTDPTDKGFVGSDNSGTYTNNFFDSTASNQSSGTGATAKTTAEMKTLSTFTDANWDFVLETTNGTNDEWDMDTTGHLIKDGYPFLSWENGDSIALPVQMTGMRAEFRSQSSEVRLSWSTASEIDNAGWEVERRAIANFGLPMADYQKIAFVEGAGTSTSPHTYEFTDDISQSTIRNLHYRLAYRLRQLDRSGSFSYSHEAEVEIGLAPRELTLGQNYPNPFNPTTTISFSIPENGRTTLRVYDMLGRLVATLVDQDLAAGVVHTAIFDGSRLASGLYSARLESGQQRRIARMHMVK